MHVQTPTWAISMRRPRQLLAVGALVLATVLGGCSSSDEQAAPGDRYEFAGATVPGEVITASDRAHAPPFAGELLDGTGFDSAELSGDVAVINFWGSWCAPCRVETPDLQAVYADVRDDGVQFLGVDVKDQRLLASAFLDGAGAEYPSLFDPRGEVALAFNGFPANAVPSTILIDREGRVAAVYTGAITQDDLRAALDSLSQEVGA